MTNKAYLPDYEEVLCAGLAEKVRGTLQVIFKCTSLIVFGVNCNYYIFRLFLLTLTEYVTMKKSGRITFITSLVRK